MCMGPKEYYNPNKFGEDGLIDMLATNSMPMLDCIVSFYLQYISSTWFASLSVYLELTHHNLYIAQYN